MQEGWTELHAFGTQLRAIPLRLLLFIELFLLSISYSIDLFLRTLR